MIKENGFINNYTVDTNFLTGIAQFTYVLPVFPLYFEEAVASTGTRLYLLGQVEKEYKGLKIYTSLTQADPLVLPIGLSNSSVSSGTNAPEGRLNPPYFKSNILGSSYGIIYSRVGEYATLTADEAIAKVADELWQNFPNSYSGVISNDSDISDCMTTTAPIYTTEDIVWSTVHHSSLSARNVVLTMEILQRKGYELFHTHRWSNIKNRPAECALCHNVTTYV